MVKQPENSATPGTAIATALRIVWRMLERRDIDPTALFREAGLNPESLSNSRARYPGKEARHAWTRASEMLGDPSFGLTSAEVWQPTDFHALGFAFLASITLRNALNRLVRYHAVVDNMVSYSFVERDDHAILSFSIEQGGRDEPAILEDARWVVVLDACRRVYGPALDPLEVTFLHSDPGSATGKFYGFFRCPMRFGAMHMSPRSLQRKLAAENTTFRKLVEAVRQELAESYLGDDSFTLKEISYLLGFSEQPSFSRAFKRWTSFTPQGFRDAA